MRRIWLYSAIAGLLCGSVMAQTNSFWNVKVSTNLILGTSTLTTSNGTLLVDGSPITGGGITNATGPGITVASGILTLSTNDWQFGAAQTPWTTNIDAGGFSLMNVGTLAAANINFGDGSLADMLASRLSTNWTGGAITLDAANANTNTFGGFLVIGPSRYQANSSTASGVGSWANYYSTASGAGSWAHHGGTASGEGSWANYNSTASGRGSWASGQDAAATHNSTFVWSDGSTPIASTTNRQFTVYASNGIRLLGGPIEGDGSGLTGVNALTLGGVALAVLVQTNAALDALRLNNGSGLTNLNLVGSGGITNITGGGTWTLSGGAYTFVPATDASRAATGTVITVTGNGNSGSVTVGTGGTIALGSDAGKVTTNATFSQLGVRDGSGLTNIPLAALQTVPLTNNHTSAVTLGGNLTVNGTANIAPNQTASSGASVMTRDLGDARYGLLVDPTTALLWDDFNGWSGAATGYGRYGWTFAAVSGATGGGFDNSRAAYQTGSTLGIVAFGSGTSNSPAFYQGTFNNGSSVYPPLLISMAVGCTGWSNSMRVALTSTTNQLVRVGLSNGLGGILPNNWMGFEYSAGATATNWLVHQRNTSSSIIVTSTVAATTSFVTLTMWTTNTGGNVFYAIDGTTVTNLPNQPGSAWPWLAMSTTDGVSRSLVLDYWLLLIRGLSR